MFAFWIVSLLCVAAAMYLTHAVYCSLYTVLRPRLVVCGWINRDHSNHNTIINHSTTYMYITTTATSPNSTRANSSEQCDHRGAPTSSVTSVTRTPPSRTTKHTATLTPRGILSAEKFSFSHALTRSCHSRKTVRWTEYVHTSNDLAISKTPMKAPSPAPTSVSEAVIQATLALAAPKVYAHAQRRMERRRARAKNPVAKAGGRVLKSKEGDFKEEIGEEGGGMIEEWGAG